MAFKVKVARMEESHRTKFWVVLDNLDIRPTNASFLDDTGRITPFMSEVEEYAIHEASVWAKFLGVPEQATCSCLMCKYK